MHGYKPVVRLGRSERCCTLLVRVGVKTVRFFFNIVRLRMQCSSNLTCPDSKRMQCDSKGGKVHNQTVCLSTHVHRIHTREATQQPAQGCFSPKLLVLCVHALPSFVYLLSPIKHQSLCLLNLQLQILYEFLQLLGNHKEQFVRL